MDRRTIFPGVALPALLVAPQLLLTIVFFFWPAIAAVRESMTATDPFGVSAIFVGADNFLSLFADPQYRAALLRTLFYNVAVSAIAMAAGMFFAYFADKNIRGRDIYRTLMILPYAIAPALSSVVFIFLFDPNIGLIGRHLGRGWNYALNGRQAMALVIGAGAWKQVSYDFIFYLAALQSIPKSIVEAAWLDGARGFTRFRSVVWPMLAPTTMFLLVVNFVYASFDTFGTIEAMTGGGPAGKTVTMVVKVYQDGYVGNDIGGSAAQSVVLMVMVIGLTALQFRFLGKRPAR